MRYVIVVRHQSYCDEYTHQYLTVSGPQNDVKSSEHYQEVPVSDQGGFGAANASEI